MVMEQQSFPVDGELLRILPRAGVPLKSPDIEFPKLRAEGDKYYLEMRVRPDLEDQSEIGVTRRIPLEDISAEDWEELKVHCAQIDYGEFERRGLSKGLERIPDVRLQRLLATLVTFLNPRQVAILLHLYREAARQGEGPTVTFNTNDLLESLGYARNNRGCFHSRVRSKLNQDLVGLHRVELVFAESEAQGDSVKATLTFKNILRIKKCEINNLPRDFDWSTAADFTFEAADSYTVELEFFDGVSNSDDYVLFPSTIDISQKLGSASQDDYRTRLLTYLANRLRRERPADGTLSIAEYYLMKNLSLFGSNSSRNRKLLWRTIEQLKEEGFILESQEVAAKGRKRARVLIRVNCQKLKLNQDVQLNLVSSST